MKKIFFALLLCLLLCGCGTGTEETLPADSQTIQPSAEAHGGFYDPDNTLEAQTGGAVRVFPLSMTYCRTMTTMGTDLLVLSEGDTGTRLTVLTGDTLAIRAERELDLWLQDQYSTIIADGEGLSYLDTNTRETVILDEDLREVTRIGVPQDVETPPLLSPDRQTLYYCSGDSLYALDLQTRLPRVLRQFSGSLPVVDALLLDGSIVKCIRYEGGWQTLFLSAENGQLLREENCWYDLVSHGNRYIASFYREDTPQIVFGAGEEAPRALYIPDSSLTSLLGSSFAAVRLLSGEEEIRLDYYDLSSGKCTSSLTLEGDCFPTVLDGGDGILWLLVSDPLGEVYSILRWDTHALPSWDDRVYTDAYHTRQNPDREGIEALRSRARALEDHYGVEILLGDDVLRAAPWDYTLTDEYLVPVLRDHLDRLENQLSLFPDGFFWTLTEDFSGLTVCLARSIHPNDGAAFARDAGGLQYWIDNHACIALTTADFTEGSFYHELCHVMDTRIFTHSNAYDQWEEINPSGFAYDYDYEANANRNAGEYLRDAERCFIDTYSMSFPREDRARVLEYAMTEGNAHYFQSPTMQKKLLQICLGIREAFGLKKSPDTFLWEQYLTKSLAYGK